MYVAIICTYIFLGCVFYMWMFGYDGMYTTIMVTQDKVTHHILNGTSTQSKCTHVYMWMLGYNVWCHVYMYHLYKR